MRRSKVVIVAVTAATIIAACSPGEGPESIPLPTSPDTTSTTTTTTTTSTLPPTTLVPPTYEATIRRTTDGVPHITGDSVLDVAYGQGWVSGEDHTCALADQITKIYGERSRYLGPGADGENLESDFAWKAIDIVDVAADDFADTASAEVVEQFEAFTAGWNDHLAEVGADNVSGWCAAADWVRPLEPVEVYAYSRSIALLASSGRLTDFIAAAQPPEPADDVQANGFATAEQTIGAARRPAEELVAEAVASSGFGGGDALASNAWAIGSERAAGGDGSLLVGNPHFPWEGALRFAEAHLTVPGEYDIYGANLLGVPGIGIGFTEGVAWTHTVSAGKRLTGYRLTLDPESPTSYLVDGVSTPMASTDYSIEILRADGTVDTETRTLWRSDYGPIIDFPGIGWTDDTVLTFRDANIDNDEFVEQYARMPGIQSVEDLITLTSEYQGVPLFNTVAADSSGVVWYADTSATPNLSPEAELAFRTQLLSDPITQAAYDAGFVLLDGSNSLFRWDEQPGARDPGLVPFTEMPMIQRTDHVFNANDSFWVPNAEVTLDGDYSILHGEQQSPLSMRTRRNAAVLDASNITGLAGDDGLFTGEELRDATFDNTGQTPVLLRRAAVDACRLFPSVEVPVLLDGDGVESLPAGSVDLSEACEILAAWNDVYDLDSSGAIIWREAIARFDAEAFDGPGPLFDDDFDAANPTRTPAVPSANQLPMLQALARAVQTLEKAGFALDTTLGAAQFTERSETRIPLHGGTSSDGVTNIVTWSDSSSASEPVPVRGEPVAEGSSLRGEGYRINYGTSFVLAVDFTAESPRAWSLLTYGQTGDRTSPLLDSQTIRFSEKNWRDVLFTDDAIAADPDLREYVVVGR